MLLNNVLVELFNLSGEKITETRTNQFGNYELFVSESGQYKLKFTDEERGVFEWFDEQATFEDALILNINVGNKMTINEEL